VVHRRVGACVLNPEVDKGDRKHLGVSVVDLPAGRYRVMWRAVSVDAHTTEGDFTFDVSR
jgi:methionine-rich copper-binding protein CopC